MEVGVPNRFAGNQANESEVIDLKVELYQAYE